MGFVAESGGDVAANGEVVTNVTGRFKFDTTTAFGASRVTQHPDEVLVPVLNEAYR